MNSNFKKLFDLNKSNQTFESLERLLFWDQETMMPKNGINIKTLQKKELASLIHSKKTSKEYKEALLKLIDIDSGQILDKDLDIDQKRCVEVMRSDYQKAVKLPNSFVSKMAEVSSEATHTWIEAKEKNDFAMLEPHLQSVIDLMREKADHLGYEDHPYDALVNEYEPHMTVKTLDNLFNPLKESLSNLTKKCAKNRADDSFLYGVFDTDTQLEIGKKLLLEMGLEEGNYRLDLSAHPFCMPVHANDLRLTTRIEDSSFHQCLSATMHEGGHALYEQGILADQFGLPIGQNASIGVHESQSKFWETFIGQSLPFLKGFYPKLQSAFPKQLGNTPLSDYYEAVNLVQPSLIRIHADEVTYGLHVILRYEIEKAFVEGKMKVKDLPEVWNEKMEKYLGMSPHTNREGCLQDIHWPSAHFGYFPTYALGNLYAAQLFNEMKTDHPDYELKLENCEYLFIKKWLEEKVHQHGRRYDPQDLIEKATGKKLSSDAFTKYLESKYTK
ncbi:MAG: carboxypeptidase M32 [Rhabdochlamydiaceae bacterium]|nr:carboxypeptidase M32 [Candidatus Amphrikana amoebophyrae]